MRKLTEAGLKELDSFLLGLDEDAMLLSELDGFLAGIVICPDLIAPSEWLPAVWGADGPAFDDEHHANEILSLIMGRYNEIARSLMRKGRYAPILDCDRDGTFLWELWAEGFARAVAMRPEGTWDAFEEAEDEQVCAAMGLLTTLAGAALSNEELGAGLAEEIQNRGDQFIAFSLETLNAARMQAHQANRASPVQSVGRNDPCPCGSGKKFKKCCLN